jgi:two-component system response regulator FlrC
MKFRTILCEDNKYVGEIIKFILEDRGHEVFFFEDPSDCHIYTLRECNCDHVNLCADIIISDISMPKVDGLNFIEQLRKKGCKIKNIALISGYWTKDDIKKARKLGCTIFFKPVSPATLTEWLDVCEKDISPERILSDFQ